MEAMNLAVAWNLPVLFVCKDNEWAITTLSDATTGGRLVDRAHGFGMTAVELDGSDVEVVWVAAHEAIDRARHGGGPTFLHAHCTHPEGHLLGDPLLRIARHPLSEVKEMAGPQVKSFTSLKGASLKDRLESVRAITSLIGRTFKEQASKRHDPLEITRQKLKSEAERRQALEVEVTQEVEQIIHAALLPG
jgi:TPP-dependent pyruvate/acetoin dehydrogenase alpha subunit